MQTGIRRPSQLEDAGLACGRQRRPSSRRSQRTGNLATGPRQDTAATALVDAARNLESQMLARLRSLVELETPTGDKAAVDGASSLVARWAAENDGVVRWHRHANFGDSLELRFGRYARGSKPILLLGHLDTVWEKGTLARMPWIVDNERISGPGVLDMKAGVVMALAAVAVSRLVDPAAPPVTLLLHGDEEVGSPASRRVTEAVAAKCSCVYVLEPAQGEAGAYKTARKAVGMYKVSVHGVAAHSGVDFQAGHSAIVELARQIERLSRFNDPTRGITINPGVIGGGTQSNVVAAEAWVEVDVRLQRKSDIARLDRAFRALRPHDTHCRIEIEGGVNRPPMERTAGTIALFRRARKLGKSLGIELGEMSTGGGSDGNFTSALGIPTLDGMGAVGSGAHAAHEHILPSHLAPRTALLAAMLL